MRILLATDGSTHAKTATEWLKEFPLPSATAILVVSVAALPHSTELSTLKDLRDPVLRDVSRVAEEARATLASRWPGTEVRVVEGNAAEEIIRAAEEWQASLVVVGARGLGPARRFLLGSVSHAVAHLAPCPVLVVRRKTRAPRRIFVAVDGSDGALQALKFVAALGLGPAATIHLVAVAERFRFPSTAPGLVQAKLRALLEELRQERLAEMKKVLDRGAAALTGIAKATNLSVLEGDPAEKIIATLEAQNGDLVVMGARGLGPVKRFLLGSVSERVLAHAPCAVLIVRQPTAEGR